MIEKKVSLKDIILLSDIILQKAKEDYWDEVSDLQENRDELIKLFFSNPLKSEDQNTINIGIQSIISIDNNIMSLISLTKADISKNIRLFESGKKVVQAYLS